MFIRSIALACLALTSSLALADGKLVKLNTRAGVTQSIYLIKPSSPVASVILVPGGTGVIKLGPDGPENGGNFLVRSRDLFAERGMIVAVVDAPSDLLDTENGLKRKRIKPEHALDLAAVADFLRKEANVPVWIVGTSRGTISATSLASQKPDSIHGVVLTASVSEGGKKGQDSVLNNDLTKITAPVLIVHHARDECDVSPFSGVSKIREKLVNSKTVEVLSFDGGSAKQKNGCKPKTYHGFFKIEDEVVGKISDWIKSH